MKQIMLILLLQLIYVPIFTMRTIFLVKNMSFIAASLGFAESLIYVFGLSLVFTGEKSVAAMVVYAVGFGVGILIGSFIEQKLAFGYTTLVANLMNKNEALIQYLRSEGFGVTVFEGEGRDSKRYKLEILTKRNREEELLQLIEEHEPKAFIISYEPRRFKGGFLVNAIKRRMQQKKDKEQV